MAKCIDWDKPIEAVSGNWSTTWRPAKLLTRESTYLPGRPYYVEYQGEAGDTYNMYLDADGKSPSGSISRVRNVETKHTQRIYLYRNNKPGGGLFMAVSPDRNATIVGTQEVTIKEGEWADGC